MASAFLVVFLFYVSNIKSPTAIDRSGFFGFVQHEHTLMGASPLTALIVGRLQPKAKVSAARRNLKEAGGKHLV